MADKQDSFTVMPCLLLVSRVFPLATCESSLKAAYLHFPQGRRQNCYKSGIKQGTAQGERRTERETEGERDRQRDRHPYWTESKVTKYLRNYTVPERVLTVFTLTLVDSLLSFWHFIYWSTVQSKANNRMTYFPNAVNICQKLCVFVIQKQGTYVHVCLRRT